jgi:hypothetical protein
VNGELLAVHYTCTTCAVGHTTVMLPMQEAVSKTLWRMGISHSTQHLTSDGMFCVDIALDGEQVALMSLPTPLFMPALSALQCAW